jgi:hypothetical protein
MKDNDKDDDERIIVANEERWLETVRDFVKFLKVLRKIYVKSKIKRKRKWIM